MKRHGCHSALIQCESACSWKNYRTLGYLAPSWTRFFGRDPRPISRQGRYYLSLLRLWPCTCRRGSWHGRYVRLAPDCLLWGLVDKPRSLVQLIRCCFLIQQVSLPGMQLKSLTSFSWWSISTRSSRVALAMSTWECRWNEVSRLGHHRKCTL